MTEFDEFQLQAVENRKKFAREGEIFGFNCIIGIDYPTKDEARTEISKEHPDMGIRFEDEHIVTDDGLVMTGEEYASREVLGTGVKQNFKGVAVYLKPK